MVCDHIEIAEEGRTCEICSVLLDDGQLCSLCTRTMNELHNLQASPGYGDSLVHVLTSLQKWARDIPAWDLIQGVDVLMKPINQRYDRPEQHRIAPFVVLEGPDFSGKTFHAEAVSLWLTQQGFAVQTLTFPNNQTPLGRFLKRALRDQVPLSMWTHHVLFSLHRWEFASWITDVLSRNYALVVERYAWSGTTYSWASTPQVSPSKYMLLDAGLPQPDLVICLDTPFSDVISRGGVPPSMFMDVAFQTQLRSCYADPRIWQGINVIVHETQLNRWTSRKNLIRRIQGEPLLRSNQKPWSYLWEQAELCQTCCMDLHPNHSLFRCYSCAGLIHYGCLMENSLYEKVPICYACASGSGEQLEEIPPEERMRNDSLEGISDPENGPVDASVAGIPDFYLNPLEEIVLDTGVIPCSIHGYDHLSRDPTCEFCKKAIGPLYRHLSKKYGMSLGDHTPTLSFDFSGPHPIAVTGARFMLLFVWRLDTVRLLWAFAVPGKTKECVRSCLNDVVAELNAYTGGSKPPVLRIHSDQAREFLSQAVMEWLMRHNIKQTFTSTGDPSSNGVAERWIDLVKVKATVLLASRYLPTTFWCYAVPWVAYTYNQKTLGQTPKKSIPEFGQLILVRAKRDNKFQDRAELGVMMGFYPQIPHGVIAVTIQRNKTISEIYTAHVAPAHMEKTEKWFLKRDVKNPDRLVYVSTKGEVAWDLPTDRLPTVEEKRHWDRHPKFVSLQRARDGWAWYTSNIGRLLPNYRDIEVEGEEERLPYLGNSDFHAWQQISGEDIPLTAEVEEAETSFIPSQLRFERSDSQLPEAPTGSTGGASRRIQGEIRLPPLPPPVDSVQESESEQQDNGQPREEMAPSMETQGTIFPSQGGGVLPPTPPLSDDFRDLFEDFNRESDELPPPERVEFDSNRSGDRQEVGQGGSMSSRPPRQLRNRNVARLIRGDKVVKFHDVVDCIDFDQHYQEEIRGESKSNIFLSSQHQEDIDAMPREKWELLYDPTPSRALKRTRQQASIVAQQMLAKSHISTVCLLDQKSDTTGYTVLSDVVTKKMDREERKYQKAMMICVQGIGASLNSSVEALDVIDGMGQSHHESLRSTKWELWGRESVVPPIPNVQPWASVIQQTLAHQNVPEYFQKDDSMRYSAEILDEEEVLQTTTCTPKDIYTDLKGWTTAFEVELFSFQTLDVKLDVREDTLDLRRVTILPGKAVMVKKPNGDGTHKKKARVVVCGNFQQVQPGEETCANTPSFPMLRVLVSLASLHGWSVASWDVSTAFLYASLPEDQEVYCRPPNVLVRLGLVQPGIVWRLKKALYGLRTSPKAWEEERDQKLGQLKWDTPHGKVGLVKVESANCVWMIQALEDKACSNPLGMVIAYVDDIIAVGEQDQLDGMKAELDKLYVMKTSGYIPSTYDPEVEPLRFLGCLIERIPSGQIIMHQRSYIDHCLKSNDMEKLKGLTTLPAVDERSPPEEEVDENGQATDYEEHKSACQKYIGQFMWLATRTRPDISATLGILASQMVIRPKYVHGCLKQLWRYIVGTRELDMTSFEPNDVAFGELLLTLYVDASFSTGGGRSRTGIAMYLVNPIDGSESLVQWASRRQTSMATSAPEAEVSAMAEGFAASIFLFDSLKELKLVKGIGPSCILSMKTDSAVALKQLNTQSVTVRSRTAAQKLTYLRELVYQAPR